MDQYIRRLFAMLGVLVGLFCPAVANAGVIAVSPIGGSAVADGASFMIGWEFRVDAPIEIDGLAYFDAGADGLAQAHRVGIWDTSGMLLLSAEVPQGTGAPLIDGFRVTPASLLLGTGLYVIGGQTTTAADAAIALASGTNSIPGILYEEERELMTADFVEPTVNQRTNEVGLFGPSFTVAARGLPEPGVLALLGAVVLMSASVSRRSANA